MIEINVEDREYPKQLKNIKNPPQKLYAKGNIQLLYEPGIAIIGSRKCTQYGERITSKFSKELSLYGLTIISGLAEGVDSFAHKGALRTTRKTIAVLPCGFENIFPKQNMNLYNEILEKGGLVITEYEENEKATSDRFLERNRIVSGLAIGTLVVEGGYRSGTSVTARLTKEQEKKVFCIPSSLENPKGLTPNALIREGAILVTETEDIISEYEELNLKKQEIKEDELQNNNVDFECIDNEFVDIYKLLDYQEATHINDLAKKLKINISEINSKLMMLELEDQVISLPGGFYKRK